MAANGNGSSSVSLYLTLLDTPGSFLMLGYTPSMPLLAESF